MALSFRQREFGVGQIGSVCSVPDNDIARLMYYLNVLSKVIPLDDLDGIETLIDYENWNNLSAYGVNRLITVCWVLSPDEFDGKVFFQSDELCGRFGNEFYELSMVQTTLVAASSIAIAGRTRRVAKIMTYKRVWMQNNYYGPMNRLRARQQAQQMQSGTCTIL